MPQRRRAEKTKEHNQTVSRAFNWGDELKALERDEFGIVITPPTDPGIRSGWMQVMRAASEQLSDRGTYLARTFGTGVKAVWQGTDQAGRPIWLYEVAQRRIGAGDAAEYMPYPVDPTAAVLIGRKASGYVLEDIKRAVGCNMPWLIGFINGIDGIVTMPVKVDLLDHPDFQAGREDGKLLAAEYVRVFIS